MYVTEVSIREAAERLAVHPSRVRALVSAGQLTGRRVGSQWVVDLAALDRRQEIVGAGATSRALSTRVAWAAAALLDGVQTDWLTTSERARLRSRLRAHDAGEWQTYSRWLTSRQTSAARYRIAEDDMDVLLATDGVVATGASAARAYRLGLGTSGQVEVYADTALADRLIRDFFLVRSERGNALIRTVDGDWHRRTSGSAAGQTVAARLMVAADLIDTEDARSRATGTNLLNTVLAVFSTTKSTAATMAGTAVAAAKMSKTTTGRGDGARVGV